MNRPALDSPLPLGQQPTEPDGYFGRPNSALAEFLVLPEDQRRLGPFVLLRQLGRGGFAPVWLAREAYGSVELRSVALSRQPTVGGLDDLARLRGKIGDLERVSILEALDRCAGNQTRAAQELGISRRTLVARLDTYNLPRPRR